LKKLLTLNCYYLKSLYLIILDKFIIELFDKLNKNNIRYAVLRNYENLPQKDNTTEYFDLDLIVLSRDYKKFFEYLVSLSFKHKLKIAKKFQREYHKTIQIYRIENQVFINAIQIDVHTLGQNWWGNYYLLEEEILSERFKYKQFFVVSKFHENLFNWLDKLFWGNYVKKKYSNQILTTLIENKGKLMIFLKKIFGKELAIQLLAKIQNKDLYGTLIFRDRMINKLRFYSFSTSPFFTFSRTLLFFYYEIRLRILPLGLCLVFTEENKKLCNDVYDRFKLLLLFNQKILIYKGNTKIDWLIFYIIHIYPIVRKSGLVCVISKNGKNIFYSKKYSCSILNNSLIKEILLTYKKNHIPLQSNLLIKN